MESRCFSRLPTLLLSQTCLRFRPTSMTLSGRCYATESQHLPPAPGPRRERIVEYLNENAISLSKRLNEMTGYDRVEALKEAVGVKERLLTEHRQRVRIAKEDYETAVAARTRAQQDVNRLLERKDSWSDQDVSQFTALVRSDHTANAAVNASSSSLSKAESASDRAFSNLMQTILERYHEEHTWSDKIRYISTWANVLGLLVNLVVFVGAIALVEPWKRRQLVENLEERLESMVGEFKGETTAIAEAITSLRTAQWSSSTTNDATLEQSQRKPVEEAGVRTTWSLPSWAPQWCNELVSMMDKPAIAGATFGDIFAVAACAVVALTSIYVNA